jgi:IS30 family transposase
LYKHLRQSNKKRKKQYGAKDKRGQIRNRVSIDKRPAIVAEKTRLGDWEIDTVIAVRTTQVPEMVN